jgi:hypothetical protein
MRQLTVLVMLFSLFLIEIKPYVPFVKYSINKAQIIQDLCEQKDLIKNDCMGICYLDKEIKKVQENKNDVIPDFQFEKTLELYLETNLVISVDNNRNLLALTLGPVYHILQGYTSINPRPPSFS